MPRVDDQRVLTGIVFINRSGLRWYHAPQDYGSHKALYYGGSGAGIFLQIMGGVGC